MLFLVILLWLVSALSYGQISTGEVRLAITRSGQRYCSEGPFKWVDVQIRARVINEGSDQILLFMAPEKTKPDILRVLVARAEPDLAAGRYESDISITNIDKGTPIVPGPRVYRPEMFKAILPMQSFDYSATFIILITRGAPASGVASGHHSVAIVVSSWPDSEVAAVQAVAVLRMTGRIWSSVVRSNAIDVDINEDAPTEDCSGKSPAAAQ